MGGMMEGMKDMMPGIPGPDPACIISNISCIIHEMQWMEMDYLSNTIANLSLNPILTMTMQKEMTMCHAKSMCAMDESPFGPKLTKMMNYLRCLGYGFFKSCVMSEMMKLPSGPVTDEEMV